MNSTVYVYGNLGSGYTQYPNDYAQVIFVDFMNQLSSSSSQTEIAVCRDDSLMYYGYVRKLAEGQCIGFCVLLNGMMLTDFKGMFAVFENAITHLVDNGELLQFNLNGDIISKVNRLFYSHQNATNQIIDFLKDGFHKLEVSHRKLPPVSYSVSSNEVKQFCLLDNINEIIAAAHTYRTYVFKDEDFNSKSLNSYKGVVCYLNKEKKELSDELIETQTELVKIKRQKKQFRYVLLLLLAVVACFVGLFSLQGQLNDANSTNSNLRLEVNELISAKNDLLHSLSVEKNVRKNVESKLKQVTKYTPVIVTNIEIGNIDNNGKVETYYGEILNSTSTMYLSPQITYTGIDVNKIITLNIRFYTSTGLSHSLNSPKGYTYSSTMLVNQGDGNKKTIGGWGGGSKGNWSQGLYRIEIWYDDICLKSKEFIIY